MVYQAQGCGDCHKVNGAGMVVGPSLNGVARRRTRTWVEEHFAAPAKLSPGSIMPAYKLSPKDLENLVTYLFAQTE
jgi:cbb3-type cytochrome oxidase cytochrome c subunit